VKLGFTQTETHNPQVFEWVFIINGSFPIGGTMSDETKVEAKKSHRGTYILVFVALAVLTALEVTVTYLPIPRIPVLIPLALIKASLVALFYMHLKFDKKVFSVVFIMGLLMGVGLILSLIALFAPPLLDIK
jgi:cytochrome c oxidase subunit IV